MHMSQYAPAVQLPLHCTKYDEYLVQGTLPFCLEPGASNTPSDVHVSSVQDLTQEGKVSCQKYAYLYQ